MYHEADSTKLMQEEEGAEELLPRDQSTDIPASGTQKWLFTALLVYLVLLITTYICWKPQSLSCGLKSTHPTVHEYSEEETSCGPTIDTAESRGCIFDPFGNNWVPKMCYNARLAEEAVYGANSIPKMLGIDELKFYLDFNKTQYVSTENLGAALAAQVREGGELTAYTTEVWHLAHCLYMLRTGVEATSRVARGERDVWVHHTTLNPNHARHCTDVVTHHHQREIGGAVVSYGYTHCKKIA